MILEVTETAIIGNPQVARQTLESRKRAGIGISIKDYGFGFSSLGHLKPSLPTNSKSTRLSYSVWRMIALIRSLSAP
jgi:predicted signal transduction protein with EAL and GGDEF domain